MQQKFPSQICKKINMSKHKYKEKLQIQFIEPENLHKNTAW